MSSESVDPGHGHSPAAWTAVIIMLIAFTIGAVAFFFDAPIVVWASAKRAGYGVGGSKYQPKGH